MSEKLILNHLALAKKIAREMYRDNQVVREIGDVDDAIGVAQVALVEAARSYQPDLGEFAPYVISAIKTAILRATNKDVLVCQDETSIRNKEPRPRVVLLPEIHCTEEGAESRTDVLDVLSRAIKRLPKADAQMITSVNGLFGSERQTMNEVAAYLGIPLRTAWDRYNSAKRKLKRLLKQMGVSKWDLR